MKLTTNSQRILAEMVKQDFIDTEAYSDEAQFFDFFAAKQIMKRAELSDEEVKKGFSAAGTMEAVTPSTPCSIMPMSRKMRWMI